MNNSELKTIRIPDINSFDFMIKYSETDKNTHVCGIELHTHKEFEIYINLSGNVSFFVENHLYPLTRGDIIIARPGEYHHCVYRSDAKHTLFWILFDIDKNKDLLQFLYDSNANFISPPEESKKEIISLCDRMLKEDISELEKLYYFARLMTILKGSKKNSSSKHNNLPQDFLCMLEYIDKHISEDLKIINIANALHFSESTIERRFKEHLGISPLKYIQKKKMITASELLRNGASVLDAGIGIGYSDNSYFIKKFKDYFGTTPKQYKKHLKNGNS